MNSEDNSQEVKSKFSLRRVLITLLLVIASAAFIGGSWILISSRPVKTAWFSIVLNRHEHFLPCEQLPFFEQTRKLISKHKDFVNKLKDLGAASVSDEEIQCPSSDGSFSFLKGDIKIEYHTKKQRQAIEALLGNDFFGIPYRGQPIK